MIEEAQVALESYAAEDLDFSLLEGTWRMVYTTAPDVAPLVAPVATQGLLPVRVGGIYQRFSSLAEGRVENIIKLGLPLLTTDGDGVTLRVGASFEPRGRRSILLLFEDIEVGQVHMSEGLQALLAPAMLPRSWINQRVLMAIQEFRLRLPLNTRAAANVVEAVASGGAQPRRSAAGGFYLLSYLDEDMLVGRQQAGGGTFIFMRDADQ